MNEVDRAWVAGLLEGEGCFFTTKSRSSTVIGVQCSMTDRDILERLQASTGLGNVTGPYRGSIKPCWNWQIARRTESIEFMKELYTHMGERRRAKIDELIELDRTRPSRRRPPAHGTITMYVHAKCRCDDCRRANSEYAREYRKRKAATAA